MHLFIIRVNAKIRNKIYLHLKTKVFRQIYITYQYIDILFIKGLILKERISKFRKILSGSDIITFVFWLTKKKQLKIIEIINKNLK